MNKDIDLLRGNITESIIKLALPIMGISFLQMTYSVVDLIWVGKLSTQAVAAVGCCSFFVWIAQAFALISSVGISVGMSQSYGRNDQEGLKKVLRSGFQVNFFIYLTLVLFYGIFMDKIFGIYELEKNVAELAKQYFSIINIGLIFMFFVPAMSSVYYSRGNSNVPFKISTISLIINLILDPFLIFGIGFFPALGIRGAAIATISAQAMAAIIFIYLGIKREEFYVKISYIESFDLREIRNIFKYGMPISIQSIVHALVSIKLNSYVSGFGSASIAAFTIGMQVESISWMSSEGFAMAFRSIFGQNFGAKNFERIREARNAGLKILTAIGILAFLVLLLGRYQLISIFSKDADVIVIGSNYLMINAISELFMAYEIGTVGMLNGLGFTKYPAISSIFLNILRLPMAMFLVPIYGVSGIWAAISISSTIKGLNVLFGYEVLSKKTNGFRNISV